MKKADKLELLHKFFEKDIDDSNYNEEDYLHALGAGQSAILHSILFQPELTLIDDSVLLSWNIRDEKDIHRFQEEVKVNSGTVINAEKSFNFIEIGYIFGPSGRNLDDLGDEFLVNMVRDAWDAWLAYSYPDRMFCVEVLSPKKTGSTIGIHFFQVR